MPDNGNRLLVIDDQPELCEFIAEAAAGIGYQSRAVTSPDVFRREVLEFQPTVVVLDLQMPGADGIELLRYLASLNSQAQILVASGMDERVLANAQQIGRGQGLNVVSVLQKPIHLKDLESALRKALSRARVPTPADLRRALEQGEIQVHYQPKADRVAPGQWLIQGAEALARWTHPQLGPISPAQFIPLAEKHELIRPLSEYVLQVALRQSSAWERSGLELTVAVNLSPQLLNDLTFPDQVAKMADRDGADPRRIVFEVTESAAMFDSGITMDVLTRMRVKNFGLSIDDFGTGYSSLKQLYLMPFSELKIDISFVRDVCEQEDARVMVETMVLLAHKLKLTACAEGVETQAILDFLDSVGCDRAQGYFIGRPMPGENIAGCVQEWNSRQTPAKSPEFLAEQAALPN